MQIKRVLLYINSWCEIIAGVADLHVTQSVIVVTCRHHNAHNQYEGGAQMKLKKKVNYLLLRDAFMMVISFAILLYCYSL